MRIATYNVQSGRDAWGQLHLDRTAEAILSLNADICGLNEVRVGCSDSEGIDQVAYLARRTNMEGRFARAIPLGDGAYGVGLLSRFPIERFEVHPVPEVPPARREPGYYEPRVIYRAEVLHAAGRLAVYGTHFGLTRPERAHAVSLLKTLLSVETLPDIVFMGDLNAEPDDPVIREVEGLLVNTHRPGLPMFTHHALNLHGTIDYIFLSPSLRFTPAQAVYTTASDHLPILVDIG